MLVIPTMLAVATVVFFLLNVVPGDIMTALYGGIASPAQLQQMRVSLGLSSPVYIRYFQWLASIATGNLGYSLSTNTDVSSLIAYRLPVTLTLASVTMLVAVAIAIPVGVISATRRNTKTDSALSVLSMVGLSVPSFYLGIVAILVFSIWFKVLPSGGYVPLFQDPISSLEHLFLPAATLGVILAAYIMRMTRSSLLDVLSQEFILVLRAKGLSERTVLFRHALRNSLVTVVTAIGLQMSILLGGSLVIENIFRIPGMGSLLLTAVADRDYLIVTAEVLVYAALIVAVNTAVDIVYTYLDPRIKLG